MNGTHLPANNGKYQGVQADVLAIFDAQDTDQGIYACSVANSASGINTASIKLVVGKLLYITYLEMLAVFKLAVGAQMANKLIRQFSMHSDNIHLVIDNIMANNKSTTLI